MSRAPGDISVTRSDSSNETSSWGAHDTIIGGYTWTITFPLSARDAPELGFDGAALEGNGAAGNVIETRMSRVPEVQRVSTMASSEMYGFFTLTFGEEETEPLPFNATGFEVGNLCAYIGGLGDAYPYCPLRDMDGHGSMHSWLRAKGCPHKCWRLPPSTNAARYFWRRQAFTSRFIRCSPPVGCVVEWKSARKGNVVDAPDVREACAKQTKADKALSTCAKC